MKSTAAKKSIWSLLILSVTFLGWGNGTVHASDLQKNIDDAVGIIRRFRALPEDETIPADVLRHAKGLVIMSVIKVGFVFSGHGGEGIVIARTPSGAWSAPSGVATAGAGVGFQAGGQNTEFVIVLNTDAAVHAFEKGTSVKLGGELSVAAGPVGRNINGSVMPNAAIYSYSRSEGLFAGVSLDGAVIAPERDANEDYYGDRFTARHILSGEVPIPPGATRLIRELSIFDVHPVIPGPPAIPTNPPAPIAPVTPVPTTTTTTNPPASVPPVTPVPEISVNPPASAPPVLPPVTPVGQ